MANTTPIKNISASELRDFHTEEFAPDTPLSTALVYDIAGTSNAFYEYLADDVIFGNDTQENVGHNHSIDENNHIERNGFCYVGDLFLTATSSMAAYVPIASKILDRATVSISYGSYPSISSYFSGSLLDCNIISVSTDFSNVYLYIHSSVNTGGSAKIYLKGIYDGESPNITVIPEMHQDLAEGENDYVITMPQFLCCLKIS